MEIGIAYDLKSEIAQIGGGLGADDRLEEYDSEETIDAMAFALEANGLA